MVDPRVALDATAHIVDVVYIARIQPDRGFEYVSPSITAMMGYTPEEHYRDADLGWRVVDPRDVHVLDETVSAAVGAVAEFTIRWIARDGHLVWTHHVCRKVRREDGSVAIYGVARDVTAQHAVSAALAQTAERYRLLASNASDVVVAVDLAGRFTWVSQSVTRELGWTVDDLVGTAVVDVVHPDDIERMRAIEAQLTAAESVTLEVRVRRRDGGYRWMSALTRRLTDEAGGVIGLIAGWRDVQAIHDARNDLTRAEAQYHLIADNVLDVVFQSGPDQRVQWVSPSVTQVLGWHPAELIGEPLWAVLHADDSAAAQVIRPHAGEGDEAPADIEVRARQAGDGWRWMRLIRRTLHDESGRLAGSLDTLRDINPEVTARQDLDFHVTHDTLTGLGNRDLLLASVAARAEETSACTLLCFQIDNLAEILEAYTHSAWDAAISTVAQVLLDRFGGEHQVFRTGDNQITVLLADGADEAELMEVASQAQSAAEGIVPLDGTGIDVSLSVGIAVGHGKDVAELLRDATTAMRHARFATGHHVEFANPTLAAKARARIEVRGALSRALQAGQLDAWYQPVVDLVDGRPRGHEALVRWVHEDGTVEEPASFLPVAEASGLIVALDAHILHLAVHSLRDLPAEMHVSVNVSALSLAGRDLAERVAGVVRSAGIDPTRLHLEVTETSLIDVTPGVLNTMNTLSDLGIRWWVDDFGTGYSSVSHIRDLPVHGLKLDRSFTAALLTDERTGRLAAGLAGLARGMGLATIAEGVESDQQALILRSLGWEWGQGWLYGKAAPLPDVPGGKP